MKQYIFHIGLPKTGTCFLQDKVFPKLDENEISYNPKTYLALLRDYMYGKICKTTFLKEVQDNDLLKGSSNKIFISEEGFSVDGYSFEYQNLLERLQDLYPQSKIIISFRFQTDWLLSLFKQSVQQQNPQSIENFLNFDYSTNNFRSGTKHFQNRYSSIDFIKNNTLPSLDVFTIDYGCMIEDYQKAFGKENVCVMFYENFKKDQLAFLHTLFNLLDVSMPEKIDLQPHYRLLSAMGIEILVKIDQLARIFGVKISYSLPNVQKKYSSIVIKNSNGNIKVKDLMVKMFYFIFLSLSWVQIRKLFQNHIDKLYYMDWDMLEKFAMRGQIEKITAPNNQKLLNLLPQGSIPSVYLEGVDRAEL